MFVTLQRQSKETPSAIFMNFNLFFNYLLRMEKIIYRGDRSTEDVIYCCV